MNITILLHGYGLMEILTEELSKIGLQATQADYKKTTIATNYRNRDLDKWFRKDR
jgi:hypothetical protein